MSKIEKVAVIGLDCAEPSLVFDRWADLLPNTRRLMQRGTYGCLTSCLPPITVPAWSCMASSRDPGTLGIYGFRNRKDYNYDGFMIATSQAVQQPRVWDLLSAAGKDNIVVGVPGTFPIMRPLRGSMVTCFLTPGTDSPYTHPPVLKQQIADWVGDYMFDVTGFRTEKKDWLLQQIYQMTDRRFEVVKRLVRTQPWDLLWLVEMGHDRIHHGFWQYMDPSHHRYTPGNPFEHAIRDYYVHVDGLIGELLGSMDLDKTAVWMVSDHGAKCMLGGFCFNDWLIQEGYLVLKEPVSEPTRFDVKQVDWSRTRAWGEGGYYGRLMINLQGREPQGVVPRGEYERFRRELQQRLEALTDPQGRPMGTRAYLPQEIYHEVNGFPPDLVVIFGDLSWRSVGTIGNPSLYTYENDTGPDDANHAQQGMYILSHPALPARGRVDGPTLYDVAPTILTLLGVPCDPAMRGRSLVQAM